MKRPFCVIGCSAFLSAAVALFFPVLSGVLVLLVALTAGVATVTRWKARGCVLAAAVCAGCAVLSLMVAEALLVRPVLELSGKELSVSGRVVSAQDTRPYLYRLDCRVPLPGGGSAATTLRVYANEPLPISVGNRITARVAFYENTLPPSYTRLARRELLTGRFLEPPVVISKASGLLELPSRIRAGVIAANEQRLPPRIAALVNAMLLGERDALSDELSMLFTRSGLVHLMAVSGFHISLLLGLVLALLRGFRLSERMVALLSFPALLLFMAVSGFTPSVVRAGLMSGVMLLSILVGRQYDSLSALGFSGALIALFSPYSVLQPSFLLSFSATLSMLVLTTPIKTAALRLLRLPEDSRGLFPAALSLGAVSLSASIGSLPFVALSFGSISLISPVASFCVIPLVTLLLWCALFNLLLGAIFPPIGVVLSMLCTLLGDMITTLAAGFGSLLFAAMPVEGAVLPVLMLLLLLLLFILKAFSVSGFPRLLAIAPLCLLLMGGVLWQMDRFQQELVVLGTREGGGILLVRGEEAVLIGFPEKMEEGAALRDQLTQRNVRRLVLAISTKEENAQIGAVPILERYPPQRLVIAKSGNFTENILIRALPDTPILTQQAGVWQAMGTTLELRPCCCGFSVNIFTNGVSLLKYGADCAIIKGNVPEPGSVFYSTLALPQGLLPKISEENSGNYKIILEVEGS